ncbi:hypothetical protein AshY1_03510 [Candidatus Phytoplasma fraxini]|uniref:Uncharacterized protein n=1 Tax=Ash yellows phytoplasma TaxID=35780 RepID=A0ABZ2U876_ASHYP
MLFKLRKSPFFNQLVTVASKTVQIIKKINQIDLNLD